MIYLFRASAAPSLSRYGRARPGNVTSKFSEGAVRIKFYSSNRIAGESNLPVFLPKLMAGPVPNRFSNPVTGRISA